MTPQHRAFVGLCLALGACAPLGVTRSPPPSEGVVQPTAAGPLKTDTRPALVLSGTIAAVGGAERAPGPSGDWGTSRLLWGTWPSPTPGDPSWAEAWGLALETRFVYSIEAPAGRSALRSFAQSNPCQGAAVAQGARQTLWLEPVPNVQRFVEALRWWLAGRGWSAVADDSADAARAGRLATLTDPASETRAWVEASGDGIVLRLGSEEALELRAPASPRGLDALARASDHARVRAQIDLPALAALEAALQASAVARVCDALRDETIRVRDEVIAAQLDVAAACVRSWTSLAEIASAVEVGWSAEGPLSVEGTLTPLGQRAWWSATRPVALSAASGQAWGQLAWAAERQAFIRSGESLSELPSTWTELVETSAACALDATATRALTALVAAPALLPGATGDVLSAFGGVDGVEVSQLSLSTAFGASAHEDRAVAVVKSNRPFVPNALWGSAETRDATVRVGDDTLTARERVAADGVWTALASGEPLGAVGLAQETVDAAPLDPPDVTRWFALFLAPGELARAAQRRGFGAVFPELTRAAAHSHNITVSAMRGDGRIVYRLGWNRSSSAGNER